MNKPFVYLSEESAGRVDARAKETPEINRKEVD